MDDVHCLDAWKIQLYMKSKFLKRIFKKMRCFTVDVCDQQPFAGMAFV